MNCSTTRCTTPAAAPRTGRGESALPRPDQGTKTQLPFAALPHDLRKDPRLKGNQTAIVLAATLLEYAMTKAYCYPTNATLAADMGCCVSTIRNALAALRAAGWIRIELGPRQPNGRRIWLTWRTGNRVAGNQVTGQAPAQPSLVPEYQHREHLGARNQVASGAGLPQVSDTRQPVAPRVQPADSPVQPAGPPAQPTGPHTQPAEPERRIVVVEAKGESSEETRVTDPALRPRPAAPLASHPGEPPVAAPEAMSTRTAPCTLPFDLTAIGAAPELRPTPVVHRPAEPRRRRLGLDLAELTKAVGETADPILAAELARRTAPPALPEPPPAAVPTAELLANLPGRHDLIMVAARRLSEETGDYKAASLRTFEKMAEAVATRAVPPSVLLDCWRQGMGPKSEHKGKVLVAAWKRSVAEAPLRC